MYYEELIINRDINICFFSGKIISEPDFRFFYNSKKYLSKVSFLLKTKDGFVSSKNEKSVLVKAIAYNEMADFVYRNCNINDIIIIRGFLQKDEVVICEII